MGQEVIAPDAVGEPAKVVIEEPKKDGMERGSSSFFSIPGDIEKRLPEYLREASLSGKRDRWEMELPFLKGDVIFGQQSFQLDMKISDEEKKRTRNIFLDAIARIGAYNHYSDVLRFQFLIIQGMIMTLIFLSPLFLAPALYHFSIRLTDWPGILITIGLILLQFRLVWKMVTHKDEKAQTRNPAFFLLLSILIIAIFELEHLYSFNLPFLTPALQVAIAAFQFLPLYVMMIAAAGGLKQSYGYQPLAFTPPLIILLNGAQMPWLAPTIKNGLLAGMITGLTFLLFFYLSDFLRGRLEIFLDRRRSNRHPKEEILVALFEAIRDIERSKMPWGKDDLEKIVGQLDRVAKCIERDLSTLFPRMDEDTHLWLRQQLRQMAATFRNLKQQALLPQNQEAFRESLLETLSDHFVFAADGSWGRFAMAEPPARVAVKKGLAVLQRLLPVAVLALVIAGVLLVPYPLDENLKNGILTTSSLILLSYLINLIDPTFEAKLNLGQKLGNIVKTPAK